MNPPLHPAIVHLPLGLAVVLPIAALGMAVALWKGWLPARAWLLIVGLQALLVGGGMVALSTGEQDEDRVERTAGEAAVEAHEHAAKHFVTAGAMTLAVALTALAFGQRPRWQRSAQLATFALTLGVLGLGVSVGQKGGALVYGPGGAAVFAPADAAGTTAEAERKKSEKGDDDD